NEVESPAGIQVLYYRPSHRPGALPAAEVLPIYDHPQSGGEMFDELEVVDTYPVLQCDPALLEDEGLRVVGVRNELTDERANELVVESEAANRRSLPQRMSLGLIQKLTQFRPIDPLQAGMSLGVGRSRMSSRYLVVQIQVPAGCREKTVRILGIGGNKRELLVGILRSSPDAVGTVVVLDDHHDH